MFQDRIRGVSMVRTIHKENNSERICFPSFRNDNKAIRRKKIFSGDDVKFTTGSIIQQSKTGML